MRKNQSKSTGLFSSERAESQSRRKMLAVAAVAAPGAAVSLGREWQKPVVEAILLPAHGQTSGTSISCGTIAVTDNNDASDNDMAVLIFNPETGCQLVADISPGDGFNINQYGGDVVAGIDAGPSPQPNWDHEIMGDVNWAVSPDLGQENTSTGNFNLTATRLSGPSAGNVYTVTLNIGLSGTNNVTATVTMSAVISQNS